jgi:hypothetical protein
LRETERGRDRRWRRRCGCLISDGAVVRRAAARRSERSDAHALLLTRQPHAHRIQLAG